MESTMFRKFLLLLISVVSWASIYATQIIKVGDVDYVRLDPEMLALIAKANNNDMVSQIALADRLLDGHGLKKDVLEAEKWFKELTDKNNGYAAFMLSVIYQYGIGVKQDSTLSVKFYDKGLHYDNVMKNMYKVAAHFNDPTSSIYNMERAIEWFNKAAEKGSIAALNDLAEIYLYGDVKFNNPVKALGYYGKAAALGSSYAKYSIGTIYYDGKGIEQSKPEAFKWFLRAATAGFAPAQYRLAVMYHTGDAVAQDEIESYAWFSVAKRSILFNQAEKNQILIAEKLMPEDLKEALSLAKQYDEKFVA